MAERPRIVVVIARPAVLLVTYSIAIIMAGHGVGPLGLLLIMGSPDAWLLGQFWGWLSIVALVAVTIWLRHDALNLAVGQLTASIFLYLSWFVFACLAARNWGDVGAHFFASLPFQVAFLLVAGTLIQQIVRQNRAASSSSAS